MVLSKLQWSLLGAMLIVLVVLTVWLLLKPGQREDFAIETSIKPDTYIATKIDESPSPEPASLQSGVPDGYGVITHQDGSVYMGNFQNGVSNGQGKIIYPGGASYEGKFSEGWPHGKGVCTYSSGESEDCEFLLGQRQ